MMLMLNPEITISDWIQIGIAVITLFGILTTFVISIRTLKQNSKMIEETTRPNIIIYKDVLNCNSPVEYLVIKNIGGSLAHINSINFDAEILKEIAWNETDIVGIFNDFNNSYLAPNQFHRIPIKTSNEIKSINFNIMYSNNLKTYYENFCISTRQDAKIPRLHQTRKNYELEVISNSLQELISRIS